MNCLLHTLLATPKGYFFDDEGRLLQALDFTNSSGFIDTLSQSELFEKIDSLFFVSGPSNFTALRNLSVFLQIFTAFSPKNIACFGISSVQFLRFVFPQDSVCMVPIGKRESFVISGNTYEKKKNDEIAHLAFPVFSDKTVVSPEIFQTILQNKKNFSQKIKIDYGDGF